MSSAHSESLSPLRMHSVIALCVLFFLSFTIADTIVDDHDPSIIFDPPDTWERWIRGQPGTNGRGDPGFEPPIGVDTMIWSTSGGTLSLTFFGKAIRIFSVVSPVGGEVACTLDDRRISFSLRDSRVSRKMVFESDQLKTNGKRVLDCGLAETDARKVIVLDKFVIDDSRVYIAGKLSSRNVQGGSLFPWSGPNGTEPWEEGPTGFTVKHTEIQTSNPTSSSTVASTSDNSMPITTTTTTFSSLVPTTNSTGLPHHRSRSLLVGSIIGSLLGLLLLASTIFIYLNRRRRIKLERKRAQDSVNYSPFLVPTTSLLPVSSWWDGQRRMRKGDLNRVNVTDNVSPYPFSHPHSHSPKSDPEPPKPPRVFVHASQEFQNGTLGDVPHTHQVSNERRREEDEVVYHRDGGSLPVEFPPSYNDIPVEGRRFARQYGYLPIENIEARTPKLTLRGVK